MRLFSKLDPRKGVGIVIGIVFYSLCILAFTFAYYSWRSGDTSVTFSISDEYFYCQSGFESNVGSLAPVLDYRLSSYDSFEVNNIGRYDTSFSVSMNITEMDASLKSESFKYKLMVDTTGGDNNCASTSNSSCIEVGSGDFSEMKVGMNTLVSPLVLPNNVRYDYYLFLYIDGNMENDTSMQNSSITYTLDVCEIVVFLDYHGGTVTTEFLKVTDEYVGLPTPTRVNTTVNYEENGGTTVTNGSIAYSFVDWYLDSTYERNILNGDPVQLTINHTLHAKWNPTNSVTLPSITRTGYTFSGWYSDSALTNKVGDIGTSYTPITDENSVTLYAKWTANNYNIAYSVGAGTKGSKSPTSATYDVDVEISNPTPLTGYTFTGWSSNSDAGLNTSTAKTGTAANPSTSWSGSLTKNTFFKNLRAVSGTVTMTANYADLTAPADLGISMTSAIRSTSQTATLTCTDGVGVTGYYFGTTAPISSSTYKSITSTTSMSVTETVSSAGTYYLTCRDAAGNVSSQKTIVVNSYDIDYMLIKTTGTVGTYNTTNYDTYGSSTTYIAPSGTTLTLSSLYTSDTDIPSTSSKTTFKGISSGAPSTTAVSVVTTSPVLNTNTTYALWFDRKTYTVTLTKGTGISSVTGDGTYRWGASVTINATPSTGYIFTNWTGTHSTITKQYTFTMPDSNVADTANARLINYSISYNLDNGTAGSNAPTSATYNDVVQISNPTRTGYTFAGWTFNGNTSTAKYGTSSGTVTTSWSSTATKVTAGYFKNLTATDGATVTMKANWTPRTDTAYTVEHYVMEINGNYPSTATSTQNLTGTTGATVTFANLKLTTSDYNVTNGIVYSHGTTGSGGSGTATTILADGSLVIKLYYKRTYGILRAIAGTNISSVSNSNAIRYYYGATITSLSAVVLNAQGYTTTFEKWTSSNTTYIADITTNPTGTFTWPAMPEGTAITLTASAVREGRQYTITLNPNASTSNGTTVVVGTSQIYEKFSAGIYLDSALTKQMTADTNSITIPQKRNQVSFNKNSTGATISATVATVNHTYMGHYTSLTDGTQMINSSGYITSDFTSSFTTANTVLYAVWNDGTITLPTVVKSGNNCWWNTAADGSGTNYMSGEEGFTTSKNMSLYAICKEAYTITLDGRGATTQGSSEVYEVYGTGIYRDYFLTESMTSSKNKLTPPTKEFTVTYNLNSTGATSSKTSETITYEFQGYFKETAGTTIMFGPKGFIKPANFTNTTYTADATLYAIWDGFITLPTIEKENYACYWNTKSTGTGTSYASGKSGYKPNKNITLYAICKEAYTITLNGNGATSTGTSVIYEEYGTGVFKDSVLSNEMTTSTNPITKPSRSYTVSYSANGFSDTSISVNSSTISYTYNGHYTNTSGGTQMINSSGYITDAFTNTYYSANSTLHAQWTASSITLATISKTGYTCKWNTTSDGTGTDYNSGQAGYTTTANITLYAKCEANTYTVTMDANGGTHGSNYSSTWIATYGQIYNMSSWIPTKPGYAFAGWADPWGTIYGGDFQYLQTGDFTFTAQWTPNTITVQYIANCPTTAGGSMSNATYNYGNSFTIATNAYTCSGYTFSGWNFTNRSIDNKGFGCTSGTTCNESNGLGWYDTDSISSYYKYYNGGTAGSGWHTGVYSGTITASAVWTPAQYTVTFDSNLFTTVNNSFSGVTVTYDSSNSYLTINGTLTGSGSSFMAFYGHSFTAGDKYKTTLTYVSGSYTGGANSLFTMDIKNSSGGSLSTRNFVDTQFPTSGSNTSTLTISSTAASEGSMLYVWLWTGAANSAVFTNYKIKVNITKVQSKTVTYNSTYGTLPTPTRLGHTFNGWYTAESGGTKITSTSTVTTKSNHTLYARWSINSYAVTLNGNMFNTVTKNKSGVNVIYDPATSYLTLNGTQNSNNIKLMIFKGLSFSQNDQFLVTLTYISGSYTASTSGTFVTEVINGESGLSARNNIDNSLPTSGTSSKTLTVSSVGASEGSSLYVWIWNSSGNTWTYNNYKIKVNITKVQSKSVTYNSTYGTLTTPTRLGYTFNGWYTAESGGRNITSSSIFWELSNQTLYAQWTIKQSSLTVNPNGGTWAGSTSSKTITKNYGTEFYIPEPTRTGYAFAGWTMSSGLSLENLGTIAHTDTQFANSMNDMTVYNNSGGGTVTHTKTTDSSNPFGGGNVVKITTSGTASPGAGGFRLTPQTSKANNTYYQVIIAKIPTGYTICAAWNHIWGGTGVWLTSQAGTGSYQMYILKITTGADSTATSWGYSPGQAGDFGHIYLTGSNNTSVTWYVSYANMLQYNTSTGNQSSGLYIWEVDNHTLTAKWSGSGSTAYKVEHYVMNTSGSYPTTATSTQNLTGTTGATITLANLKQTTSAYNVTNGIVYSHGTVGGSTVSTTTILADGSRVIKLYYKRTYGTLTTAAGTYISGVTTQSAVKYYYGATVPTLSATLQSATGYTYSFSKWTSSNTTYMANKTSNPTGTFTWPAMPEGTAITLTASATRSANCIPVTLQPKAGSVLTSDAVVTGGTTVYLKYNTGWYSNSSCSTAISDVTEPVAYDPYTNAAGSTVNNYFRFRGYYTSATGGTKIIGQAQGILSGKTAICSSACTLYAIWSDKPVINEINYEVNTGIYNNTNWGLTDSSFQYYYVFRTRLHDYASADCGFYRMHVNWGYMKVSGQEFTNPNALGIEQSTPYKLNNQMYVREYDVFRVQVLRKSYKTVNLKMRNRSTGTLSDLRKNDEVFSTLEDVSDATTIVDFQSCIDMEDIA